MPNRMSSLVAALALVGCAGSDAMPLLQPGQRVAYDDYPALFHIETSVFRYAGEEDSILRITSGKLPYQYGKDLSAGLSTNETHLSVVCGRHATFHVPANQGFPREVYYLERKATLGSHPLTAQTSSVHGWVDYVMPLCSHGSIVLPAALLRSMSFPEICVTYDFPLRDIPPLKRGSFAGWANTVCDNAAHSAGSGVPGIRAVVDRGGQWYRFNVVSGGA